MDSLIPKTYIPTPKIWIYLIRSPSYCIVLFLDVRRKPFKIPCPPKSKYWNQNNFPGPLLSNNLFLVYDHPEDCKSNEKAFIKNLVEPYHYSPPLMIGLFLRWNFVCLWDNLPAVYHRWWSVYLVASNPEAYDEDLWHVKEKYAINLLFNVNLNIQNQLFACCQPYAKCCEYAQII